MDGRGLKWELMHSVALCCEEMSSDDMGRCRRVIRGEVR